MLTFTIFSWALLAVFCAIFYASVVLRPHLLVKPSMWFLGIFHISVQIAATVNAALIYQTLDSPSHFLLLTHILPLLILAWSLTTFNRTAETTWRRRRALYTHIDESLGRAIPLGLVVMAIALSVYFAYVPVRQTGLYLMLVGADAQSVALAREDSLKLVQSPLVRYLYLYHASVLTPLLAAFISILLVVNFRRRKFVKVAISAVGILFLIAMTAWSGARLFPAIAMLIVVATLIFLKLGRIKWAYVPLGVVAVLLPALLIQVLRTDQEITLTVLFSAFSETIFNRIFFIPMHTGLQWVTHVQENGYWGLGGFARIAHWVGVEPINVPNFMMTYYGGSSIASGYMNTSFVFAYYSYFGLAVFPFLVLGVASLDFALYVYRRIRPAFMVPGIAVVNAAVLTLISSEFTRLFLTSGFATAIVTLVILENVIPRGQVRPLVAPRGPRVGPEPMGGDVRKVRAV